MSAAGSIASCAATGSGCRRACSSTGWGAPIDSVSRTSLRHSQIETGYIFIYRLQAKVPKLVFGEAAAVH